MRGSPAGSRTTSSRWDGVPRPIDLVLVRLRIGIEVKGWMFHSQGDRGASDDKKVVDLQLNGWIIIPVGWLALHTDPSAFVAQVRRAIELRMNAIAS